MKYINSNNVSIDFNPWFGDGPDAGGHFRFTKLHLYEELGGSLAFGNMDMEMDRSNEAYDLVENEKTGTITIKREDVEDGFIYTIPIFITDISTQMNIVSIKFFCIPEKDFFSKKTTDTKKTDIKATIEALYPGKKDIRCETDIQGSDILFYQNKETNQEMLTRLCYSFKKDSIFCFGFEGLMIKETMGEKNSKGKTEPDDEMVLRSNSEYMQISSFTNRYFPDLYKLPLNIWEDTESLEAIKDYTDLEPINSRTVFKYSSSNSVATPYYQLFENLSYNQSYMNSDIFSELKIVNMADIPRYKIGDVIKYQNQTDVYENLEWPYKEYLVRSNEFFISIDGSEFVDSYGSNFSWTSKLLGLEEKGSIAVGTDQDPRDKN